MTSRVLLATAKATSSNRSRSLQRIIPSSLGTTFSMSSGMESFVRFSSSWTNSNSDDREDVKGDNLLSIATKRRQFSSSLLETPDDEDHLSLKEAGDEADSDHSHQRIWLPGPSDSPLYWKDDVANAQQDSGAEDLTSLLERIEKQELEGTRMRTKQHGVLHEDPVIDMRLLTENYTITSLASALRDREEMLQHCAQLAAQNEFEELRDALKIFHPALVVSRRQKVRRLDVNKPLNSTSLETIRKALMRMPRRVSQAHTRRAGVVISICHVDGVPSILLEKRAKSLRAHPDEVCLPGGMVSETADKTIVETCLREMKEEISGLPFDHERAAGARSGITVLGVLRCNWGEVHHLVGVAVTPVVCVLGQDLATVDLRPNPDEVAEVFTIPLGKLLDKSQWIYKDDHAPIFIGGPYAIWGLTGYILERFWKDVLLPWQVKS